MPIRSGEMWADVLAGSPRAGPRCVVLSERLVERSTHSPAGLQDPTRSCGRRHSPGTGRRGDALPPVVRFVNAEVQKHGDECAQHRGEHVRARVWEFSEIRLLCHSDTNQS